MEYFNEVFIEEDDDEVFWNNVCSLIFTQTRVLKLLLLGRGPKFNLLYQVYQSQFAVQAS